MPHNVDKNKKLALLEKILSSKYFHDSEILKELLHYLVEQALNGITPKEITVAQELYKNKSFDPAVDSYVRSNVYKLRKKLEVFYENEGVDEKLRLVIPKGSYHVEFIHRHVKKKSPFQPLYVPVIILTIAVMFLSAKLADQKRGFSSRMNVHQFWQDVSKNEKPTCFVISDIVMYGEYDPELERERWILDTAVFTPSDVDTLMASLPDRQIASLEFSFVHMSNVPNFMQVAPLFAFNGQDNYFKWSSEIAWQDITQNNIVYIGDIRSLHKLQVLFDHLHVKVQAPFTLSWINDNGDTLGVYDFERTEEYRETYAAIVKIPGPNNNSILLFIGNDYPARIFTIDQFTTAAFLDDFYKAFEAQHKRKPDFFELILKVRGFKRTGYNSEILFMRPIDQESFSWNF